MRRGTISTPARLKIFTRATRLSRWPAFPPSTIRSEMCSCSFKLHPLPYGQVRDSGVEDLQIPLPEDKIDISVE